MFTPRSILLVLVVVSSQFAPAKDMGDFHFIMRKDFHAGIGWSNSFERGLDHQGHIASGIGFDWHGWWWQRAEFDFGWDAQTFKHTTPWEVYWYDATSYEQRYYYRDFSVGLHTIFWIQPTYKLPVQIGGGISCDFLVRRRVTKYQKPIDCYPYDESNGTLRIQPAIKIGIRMESKQFRRFTPEIIFHYGVMTTMNYFERFSNYNWFDFSQHRYLVSLNLSINIDPETQIKNRQSRRDARKKRHDEVMKKFSAQ